MANHQIEISVNNRKIRTLEDILPSKEGLNIIFVGKTPAPISVAKGHYFQGKQGRMFWNKLLEYKILEVPPGEYEDDYLLKNNYGITDIVKLPKEYGNEPTIDEYLQGLNRILDLIKNHKPKVIVFIYKKVLDQILKFAFNIKIKSNYGFNPQFDKYFNSKVFVFPMPGTPCTREQAHKAMLALNEIIRE